MKKTKSNNKENKDAQKHKIAKFAMGVSGLLFILLLFWFFTIRDSDGIEKLAAENYYAHINNNADFKSEINGEKSPYLLFYHFDKYKETKDINHLKKISGGNYIFYSDLARVLMVDKLIKDKKIKEAENVLSFINGKDFLSIKYYFYGIIFENKNDMKKARNYYELVLKIKESDEFLKELASLRMSFIK